MKRSFTFTVCCHANNKGRSTRFRRPSSMFSDCTVTFTGSGTFLLKCYKTATAEGCKMFLCCSVQTGINQYRNVAHYIPLLLGILWPSLQSSSMAMNMIPLIYYVRSSQLCCRWHMSGLAAWSENRADRGAEEKVAIVIDYLTWTESFNWQRTSKVHCCG